jgi:predicted DNA-binding transcriptional regulator YafY
MSKKLTYERYNWFQGQVKAKRYPNARKLAERFEISEKQAQRDIEFMRDRLKAPLHYIPPEKGYALQDGAYELPPVWFGEEELQALCLSLRLASAMPDQGLKRSLRDLLEKFLAFRFLDSAPRLAEVSRKVSVKNIEYYRVQEAVFHAVAAALFKDYPLTIEYYTPHKHESSKRTVVPLHLLCYMGRWHLIAYCTLKKGLRDFALSRIRDLEVVPKKIGLPKTLPPIKDYVRKNFGLMSGRRSVEVCLRFRPEISSWIAEQVWFSGQEATRRGDGSICLRFPVADFREVQGEVLKYGAGVEVVAPRALREAVAAEIRRMGRLYPGRAPRPA